MNLLFPRPSLRNGAQQRYALRWCSRFSLSSVVAIFLIGALAHPQAARAQNDAPPAGSQPAAVPAPAAESVPGAQNPPAAPEKSKVETPKPDAPKAEAPKADAPKAAASAGVPKIIAPSIGGKSYIIGPNDVLEVKVWNQPQISGMVDVRMDGIISIPLAGELKADGLTAIQLKDVITKRLEEVALTAPEVAVSVVRINSKHYRVYGGVLKSGEFILAERTTIMDALSQAGFKDFAKQNKIELRRNGKTLLFNYRDYIKGRNMDKNTNYELQDGDEIVVPE